VNVALVVQNLALICAQGLLVAGAATAVARLFPIERPAVKLAWWQGVLALVLALPWIQPWTDRGAGRVEITLLRVAPILGEPSTVFGRWSWTEAAVAVLASGVVARTLWLAAGLWRLRLCRRRAAILDVAATPLAGLAASLGVRATFRRSDEVGGPSAFGLRRPTILLPPAFFEMDPERQRAVAAHELFHVRRRDWLATLFEESLLALLWFHPAVHVLLDRIRLAREQCVDEAVVEALGGRQVYLESLLEMARAALLRRASGLARAVPAALLLREHHLRERVELLLKEVTMSRLKMLSHLAASASFLVLAGALAASSFPLEGTSDNAKAVEKKAAKSPEPRAIHKVNPDYPAEAKKDGIEGAVVIDARIAKDGTVAEARAREGNPLLAEAAVAAVRQWRYEPPVGPDKKPTELAFTITIRFRLD
jgi:TonB family protein